LPCLRGYSGECQKKAGGFPVFLWFVQWSYVPHITRIPYIQAIFNINNKGDFKVYVEFNDGFKGIIDFMELLAQEHSEWVRELLDPALFNTIRLEFFTLCWDNDMDFAPEYLYEQVKVKAKVA
jgi:hypothetical protein